MTMREQVNNFTFSAGFAPAVVTDTTAQVSAIIDTQGFQSLAFLIQTGTLADADATFTVLVEDGDDSGLSDAAAVADIFLEPLESDANFTFAEDDEVRKIAYTGPKRYVRCTVTPVANTGNAPLSCMAMLGNAHNLATAGNA